MAKNSRKTKSGAKTVRKSTSVSALRAERAVAAITKPLVDWCEQSQGFPAGNVRIILAPITAFAIAYFEQTPAADLTSFGADDFDAAMSRVLNEAESVSDDEINFVWDTLHLYVDFLAATGTWTGAAEDLEEIHATFHEEDTEGEFPELDVPELNPAEELEGLSSTVLAQRMEALLRWIGRSKESTSTGALRLKDIEAAAAAVGVAAKGISQGASAKQAALFADDAASRQIRTVKTMHDEPKLSLFWLVLENAGLIEFGASTVRPTSLAQKFLDGRPSDRLSVLRDLTTTFLEEAVSGDDIWDPVVYQSAMAKIALLLAGSSATPPEFKNVVEAPDPDGGLMADTPAGEVVFGWLEYMVELGLISDGKYAAVLPAVRSCVAVLMERANNLIGSDGFDDDDDFEGEAPLSAVGRPTVRIIDAAESEAKRKLATIYQLKVSLNHASPPIWRRLLVRSNVDLGTLHKIIQSSFEWDGSHLHGFQVGGRGGDVYGSLEAKSYDDPDLDEDDYTLGEVLPGEGKSMVYTYDFGDDWEHKIMVEKVLPADPSAATVRCAGGRGAGPLEDCGGVWGWARMMEAINDPKHEQYHDFRDWLELEPGETLDPKAFDWKDLNDDLSEMF